MNIDLDRFEWILDAAATYIGFQAKLFLGLKVNGRFDREATITVGASVAESSIMTIVWTDSVASAGKPGTVAFKVSQQRIPIWRTI